MTVSSLSSNILFASQKSRSSYHEFASDAEGGETHEVRESVLMGTQPYLAEDHPLNLIEVCSRVLADGREVQPQDLYNVLYLANKTPTIDVWFAVNGLELPEPMSAFTA